MYEYITMRTSCHHENGLAKYWVTRVLVQPLRQCFCCLMDVCMQGPLSGWDFISRGRRTLKRGNIDVPMVFRATAFGTAACFVYVV